MAAKKKTTLKAQDTTLRHLWLAGLGALSVLRRETLNTANDTAAKVEAFKQQAGQLANEAQANVRDGIALMREQSEAKVGQFSAEVEARLAPVLVKLGLKPKTPKAARARKASKKIAAKRPRAASARKPAAKRAVRKARG